MVSSIYLFFSFQLVTYFIRANVNFIVKNKQYAT